MYHLAKLVQLLLILGIGAALLAPVIMAFEPERLPGDFVLAWGKQQLLVPVIWSLCASGALGLFYLFYRR
jgi:hypothetical protein